MNCALTLHRCPVQISTRTGAWVFNNYTFGQPGDLGFNRMTVRPSNGKKNLLGALFLKSLVTMLQGHPTRYVLRQIENNWFLFFIDASWRYPLAVEHGYSQITGLETLQSFT